MRLLRAGEEVPAEGEVVPMEVLRELAARWYGDRLDPAWRPRTREESQRVLSSVDLVGEFWRLW